MGGGPATSSSTTGDSQTSSTGAGGGCGVGQCDLEITTPKTIGPVCAGTEFNLQLEARCECDPESAHRSFNWWIADKPPELPVTEADGILSGVLDVGVHHLTLSAALSGTAGGALQNIDIVATDRCFVVFPTEAESPDQQRLVASRLDIDSSTDIPLISGDEATVSRFDLSPDGAYLAQIELGDAGEQLALFELESGTVTSVELEYEGSYLAHAFAPDSRWLALVSTDPEDATRELLQLVDLTVAPDVVVDADTFEYEAGLIWRDAERLLFLSQWSYGPMLTAVHERTASEAGLSDEREFEDTLVDPYYEAFERFVPTPRGFLGVYTHDVSFIDSSDAKTRMPIRTVVSPGLSWGADDWAPGVRIDPLNLITVEEPYATVDTCDVIRAWSEDDVRLLCRSTEDRPIVYELGGGEAPEGVELQVDSGTDWATLRTAFSRTGEWLALAPTQDGLVVVPQAQWASADWNTPVVPRPEGTNEWDVLFTRDEDKVIVQRGRELWVASLNDPNFPENFIQPNVTLPAVPRCKELPLPDPKAWCGAPYFAGNIRLSRTETHLGFEHVPDAGPHIVTTLDLLTGSAEPRAHGELSPACPQDCIQFQ